MEVIKNRINVMKDQSMHSEDRIRKFETALRFTRQHLQTAIREKETLSSKIKLIEAKIASNEEERGVLVEKVKSLQSKITKSESRRKILTDKDLLHDVSMTKLEKQLDVCHDKYQENSIRCEEAEVRFASLQSDYNAVRERRMKFEMCSNELEEKYTQSMERLRDLEYNQRNQSKKDLELQLKTTEDHCRHALQMQESANANVLRLKRLIDKTQDEIEALQIKTKSKEKEIRNISHAMKGK